MKECMVKQKNDTKSEWISCAVPFSLRNAPTHHLDFQFENDFAILPVKMRLINNCEKELKLIKNDLAYLKTSPMPFGHFYLSNFVMMLPFSVQRYLVDDFGSKLSMGFSNVPGARKNWVVNGKKVFATGFNIPLGSTVSCGWGVMSHANNLKVMFGSDKSAINDVDAVIN
jgi:hypothetical protein